MFDLIKDESFDIQKTKDYILSIQVSLDGFSFLVVDPEEKRIVAHKSTEAVISSNNLLARRLKEWLDEESLLNNQFKSVRSFIVTEEVELIPNKYFGREWQRNISSTLFDKKLHNHFLENSLNHLGAELIFPVSKEIIRVLHQFFNKNIEIIHPLLKLIEMDDELNEGNKTIILTTKKFFYLVIFEDGKLVLANGFPSPHQNDTIYYIINTFNQLNIERNKTKIYLTGSKTQNTEIENLLNPYFNNIKNLKTESSVLNPQIIKETLPLYLTIN